MLHLNILSFVYKAINKLSQVSFHNYCTPDSYVHRYGTHQATRGDLFILLKRISLYGLKTVQYFGSMLWNTLPLFMRVASSISIFRSKWKAHFKMNASKWSNFNEAYLVHLFYSMLFYMKFIFFLTYFVRGGGGGLSLSIGLSI